MDQQVVSPVLSTTLTVAVSFNTLVSLVYGIITFRFRAYAAQVSSLQDKVERTEKAGVAKQHELTNKLIDERMRGFTHDVAEITNALKLSSKAFDLYVKDSQDEISRLNEKDHAAELKVLTQIKDMQIELARNAVTRSDLEKHESSMRSEMERLRREVKG